MPFTNAVLTPYVHISQFRVVTTREGITLNVLPTLISLRRVGILCLKLHYPHYRIRFRPGLTSSQRLLAPGKTTRHRPESRFTTCYKSAIIYLYEATRSDYKFTTENVIGVCVCVRVHACHSV